MYIFTLNKISILVLCYFLSVIQYVTAQNNKNYIEIRAIEFNQTYSNWGELQLYRKVKYEKLNYAGIPIGLIFMLPIKNMDIKLGMSDNSFAQFEYRILGSDSAWKQCSKFNRVNFRNLKYGKYQLEVKALNHGAIISTMMLKFKIDVNYSIVLYDVIFSMISIFLFYILIKMK